jgi:glycerol kinase
METTALGAAYMAGLAIGYWDGIDELKKHWRPERTFSPGMDRETARTHISNWQQALKKALSH